VLTSSLGLTTTRYTEFDTAPEQRFLKDQPFPNTPTYTMTYGASYSLPLGTLGELRARLNWRHEGTRSSDTANTEFLRVGKHGTLSGRLSFELAGGTSSIALFGSNLLDREYFSNAIDLSALNGTAQRFYAPPRTFGLELRRRF
jgi:iron complex outermembrane receptor protein